MKAKFCQYCGALLGEGCECAVFAEEEREALEERQRGYNAAWEPQQNMLDEYAMEFGHRFGDCVCRGGE